VLPVTLLEPLVVASLLLPPEVPPPLEPAVADASELLPPELLPAVLDPVLLDPVLLDPVLLDPVLLDPVLLLADASVLPPEEEPALLPAAEPLEDPEDAVEAVMEDVDAPLPPPVELVFSSPPPPPLLPEQPTARAPRKAAVSIRLFIPSPQRMCGGARVVAASPAFNPAAALSPLPTPATARTRPPCPL
jgi:hypothetical protein